MTLTTKKLLISRIHPGGNEVLLEFIGWGCYAYFLNFLLYSVSCLLCPVIASIITLQFRIFINFYTFRKSNLTNVLCLVGLDATSTFEDVGHSSFARHLLQQYAVGKLKDSSVNVFCNQCNNTHLSTVIILTEFLVSIINVKILVWLLGIS